MLVFLYLLFMIVSKSSHVAVNGIVLFFFMTEQYSIVFVCHLFFIHL